MQMPVELCSTSDEGVKTEFACAQCMLWLYVKCDHVLQSFTHSERIIIRSNSAECCLCTFPHSIFLAPAISWVCYSLTEDVTILETVYEAQCGDMS